MNRFKGLDLVDRMPQELWPEVHNTVQEAVTKTIPEKKKCKKTKWLSKEALQMAEERREVKGKGKEQRHTQLNAESERLLLNHAKTPGFLAPGGKEFNLGPETRLDHSELLCNKVLLKYKGDRESF